MSSNPQIDYFLKNQEWFRKVELRALNILYMAAPEKRTAEQVLTEYERIYHHKPRIRNRLRKLRKDGEVVSVYDESINRNLWTVSSKWIKPKGHAT